MTKLSREQAGEIVAAAESSKSTEVLMVAPDIYQGLRRRGALGKLVLPLIVNPRLLSGRWEFTENPPAKLMERVHGPAMERI